MEVFREPSSTLSDIPPTYTLEATSSSSVTSPVVAALDPSCPSAIAPLAAASNPWASEKGARRDISEYRNSVVLVDDQTGEVVGVLGEVGGVVAVQDDEEGEGDEERPPAAAAAVAFEAYTEDGGIESFLSSQAVVGVVSPFLEAQQSSALEDDFLVNTGIDAPFDLSPSLQQDLILLDEHMGPIEPYPSVSSSTTTPSILLTPSKFTDHECLPPPPCVPPPAPALQRPLSQFHDLRNSPSDISLRTLLAPGGISQLGPSGTTIRRVHSRRLRSGTVTSVGGSSFYTAREAEGTWKGSIMGGGGGSVRGGILGGVEGEGAGGGGSMRRNGEVLLRFFEERESTFLASQAQSPAASSPLASSSAVSAHLDSPLSTTSSLSTATALPTPSDDATSTSELTWWSYFSLPSQPLAGATMVWDASKEFLEGVWETMSSSSPQATNPHTRYRTSFYYHPATPPLDPDSLEGTARPIAVPKRARVPTDYWDEDEVAEARKASVWHVDGNGTPRRAWIGPDGFPCY